MKTENLSTLKIHKLTQVQYERERDAGRLDPNALYLTPDEENDADGGVKSWNDLEDKPFYETVQDLGDTITWDGTPNEDVVSFPMGDDENTIIQFFRISENAPTIEELQTGRITFKNGNNSLDFNLSDATMIDILPGLTAVTDDLENGFPIMFVLRNDNFHYEENGITIDIKKRGVYAVYAEEFTDSGSTPAFVTSLTIPNYNFTKTEIKKLDPKYLPDGGFGYTVKESVKDTLTWDGITGAFTLEELEAELEGNVLFYHASNSTPSEEEFSTAEVGMELPSGGEVTRIVLPFERLRFLQAGEDVFLATYAENTSTEHNPMLVAYKDNATAFLGVNITIPQKGIYFLHVIDENDGYSAYTYSLTIPGYTFTKEVVHKIDEKYLPDHLPVVQLTTPLPWTATERVSLTQEEGAALTKVAGAGSPVILKGFFVDFPFVTVATTLTGKFVYASVADYQVTLQIDDNGNWSAWTYFIDVDQINLTYELASQNQTEITQLKQNGVVPPATASDNGKFLQVVDGAYALVALQDVSEEGL